MQPPCLNGLLYRWDMSCAWQHECAAALHAGTSPVHQLDCCSPPSARLQAYRIMQEAACTFITARQESTGACLLTVAAGMCVVLFDGILPPLGLADALAAQPPFFTTALPDLAWSGLADLVPDSPFSLAQTCFGVIFIVHVIKAWRARRTFYAAAAHCAGLLLLPLLCKHY